MCYASSFFVAIGIFIYQLTIVVAAYDFSRENKDDTSIHTFMMVIWQYVLVKGVPLLDIIFVKFPSCLVGRFISARHSDKYACANILIMGPLSLRGSPRPKLVPVESVELCMNILLVFTQFKLYRDLFLRFFFNHQSNNLISKAPGSGRPAGSNRIPCSLIGGYYYNIHRLLCINDYSFRT